MDYSAQMIARAEHKRMVRSLSSVPEFGEQVVVRQPHWLSREAGRLLSALRHGSAALSNPLKPGHDRVLKGPLAE